MRGVIIRIRILLIELRSELSETLLSRLISSPLLASDNRVVETSNFLLESDDRYLKVIDKIPLELFRVSVEFVIAYVCPPAKRAEFAIRRRNLTEIVKESSITYTSVWKRDL